MLAPVNRRMQIQVDHREIDPNVEFQIINAGVPLCSDEPPVFHVEPKKMKVKKSKPQVNYVPVKQFTRDTDLKVAYMAFNALYDHSMEQRKKFAQKKSNVLSGSKYASRTLRNDAGSFEQEE